MKISRRMFLAGASASALAGLAPAASPAAGTSIMLGETPIRIGVTRKGRGFTVIALHQNEQTGVKAARAVVAQNGGKLIELVHSGGRNVSFSHQDKQYSIDPNRIFTPAGIRDNLRGAAFSDEAAAAVERFARSIVAMLDRRVVVSVHNNTDGAYSIRSYGRGGEKQGDAGAVFISPDHDPDDFFFVTTHSLFTLIRSAGYNVALQSRTAADDGSLSVYCARRGIPYVNVEAQHGHLETQTQMLETLLG